MRRIPIVLDTTSNVTEFVQICSTVPGKVCLVDDEGHRVNAKSLLGCIYSSIEWKSVYVETEEDMAGKIVKFLK